MREINRQQSVAVADKGDPGRESRSWVIGEGATLLKKKVRWEREGWEKGRGREGERREGKRKWRQRT